MEVLTYPGLRPIDWNNPPSATTRVASDLICGDGRRFTGSMRTVCHMAHMMDRLAVDHPRQTLHVIQPPYNTTNPSSAGTHDFDACSDVAILGGLAWLDAQRWLRSHGFDCWWRHTGSWAAPSMWHIHGFTHPLGATFATKVGEFVPGQLEDYRAHRNGLADHSADPTWFPPKPYPTFDLGRYIQTRVEADMEYSDWSKASKNALVKDVVDGLMARTLSVQNPTNDGQITVTVKQALARAANAVPLIRDKAGSIVDKLKASDSAN